MAVKETEGGGNFFPIGKKSADPPLLPPPPPNGGLVTSDLSVFGGAITITNSNNNSNNNNNNNNNAASTNSGGPFGVLGGIGATARAVNTPHATLNSTDWGNYQTGWGVQYVLAYREMQRRCLAVALKIATDYNSGCLLISKIHKELGLHYYVEMQGKRRLTSDAPYFSVGLSPGEIIALGERAASEASRERQRELITTSEMVLLAHAKTNTSHPFPSSQEKNPWLRSNSGRRTPPKCTTCGRVC